MERCEALADRSYHTDAPAWPWAAQPVGVCCRPAPASAGLWSQVGCRALCEQHTLGASVSPVGPPNERATLKQLRRAEEPMITMITRTTLMIPTMLILSPWGWGTKGYTQEAVCPADRGRVAGDAAVGACRAREGGCSWKPTVHLCSVQLVALRGGKDGSEGSHQGTAPHLPRATHIAYHALMLVQAAKPATAPHRAAATCWEGQGGRAPAQHGPKACLAWGAPEFSRGVEAAICGEGDGKMGGHRDPRPAPGSLGEPPYLPCRRGWGRSCWASWRMGRSWGPCRSRPLSWGGTPAGAVGMVKQEGLGLNSVSPPPHPPVHCTAPTPLSKTVVASVCGLLVSSPICSSFFTPPPAHSAESQIQT